jgi:hypothetical protein
VSLRLLRIDGITLSIAVICWIVIGSCMAGGAGQNALEHELRRWPTPITSDAIALST